MDNQTREAINLDCKHLRRLVKCIETETDGETIKRICAEIRDGAKEIRKLIESLENE